MRAVSRFILRRAGFIALFGTLLAIAGGYYSVLLYKNLKTDIEELLPTTARSVIDLGEVTGRLESIDSLAILIFSNDAKASRRFVDDLAAELQKAPKKTIASVEYRINQELKFFQQRAPLYMDLKDLTKIQTYIEDRISYEKKIRNPLNIFSEVNIPEPQLDFRAMKNKYEGKVSTYSRFPDGYYATPDGTKRAVLAYVPGKTADSGIAQLKQLKSYVEKSISKLNPRSYSPDMEIKYTGGVQNMLEEQAALIQDLEVSTVIVTVLVMVVLIVFFRAFRATTALLISLFMGTLWTFGISYFTVGYLNANSAFLGSIVIGNGVNFGVIFLARYMEERRNGAFHIRATYLAMSHTATATWTAALAAGLSYGSLILTGFRGFKQFGIIGLIGMVLCWISAFTLLPAFLTLWEKSGSLMARHQKKTKAYISENLAAFINRRPGFLWTLSIILTLIALGMFTKYTPNILETNLTKLQSKQSMESGSSYNSKHLDEIFQRYLSPMVILPHSRAQTLEIATRLKAIKEKQGKDSLISNVQTMDDFVPSDQPQKIEVLQNIKRLLPPRFLRQMGPADRKLVEQFLTPESMKQVYIRDLPQMIVSKFTERNGNVGNLVLVEPPLDNSCWEGNNLVHFVRDLRSTSDAVATDKPIPVAGNLPITSDMIESILSDGPQATFFAFLAVVILVTVLFRNVKTISLILFALTLGVIWLAGIILAFDVKINFLNFIALPITFGIGVDYGVNVFQRYRQEGAGSILRVIRDTGGAVMLCSLTTVIGYSSLLIADNQAFVSFGLLAVLGELTCLFAAIITLPAFLLVRDKRRRQA